MPAWGRGPLLVRVEATGISFAEQSMTKTGARAGQVVVEGARHRLALAESRTLNGTVILLP
jgi:hypothetical protein